jgi:hypothetical protein
VWGLEVEVGPGIVHSRGIARPGAEGVMVRGLLESAQSADGSAQSKAEAGVGGIFSPVEMTSRTHAGVGRSVRRLDGLSLAYEGPPM